MAAAGGLSLVSRGSSAEHRRAVNSFAFLADTHIARNAEEVVRGVRMAGNLELVVKNMLETDPRPDGVFVNGDCAYRDGQSGDYQTLASLTQPLLTAGVPLHLTLGNHDQRDNFRQALQTADSPASPVEGKHVSVVETERVNFFLLDSLEETNATPGGLGEVQRQWLEKALDERQDRPAIVFAHHDPDPKLMAKRGLRDTEELFALLEPRQQVKAYVFGHTHRWSVARQGGIHLINLPPVAYLFAPNDPNGWVRAEIGESGMVLTLHALDASHSKNNERVELAWR
jgi:3',5'-cyclic AMP phosphodiesterase CpdA